MTGRHWFKRKCILLPGVFAVAGFALSVSHMDVHAETSRISPEEQVVLSAEESKEPAAGDSSEEDRISEDLDALAKEESEANKENASADNNLSDSDGLSDREDLPADDDDSEEGDAPLNGDSRSTEGDALSSEGDSEKPDALSDGESGSAEGDTSSNAGNPATGDILSNDSSDSLEGELLLVESGFSKGDPVSISEEEEKDPEVSGEEGSETILHPGKSSLGSGNRVWFLNVSGGTFNSDMILVESEGRFGLIDAGNRYSDWIVDSDGTEYYVPWIYEDGTSAHLSCQVQGRNGKDAAIFMVETLGVTHLDFIIGTHSHSDHIGGIPEIAALLVEDETGIHSLIDEHTIFLKKEYHHINSTQDDLGEETSELSWHTQAFDYQAVQAVEEHGGMVLDISKGLMTSDEAQPELDYSDITEPLNGKYEQGDPGNWYDDSFEFLFGDFLIRLYNLFSVQVARDDNVNSIAAVITDGRHFLFTAGDLDMDYGVQQKIAEKVAWDFGVMDVIKASHHGIAISKGHLDSLQPGIVVTTAARTKPTSVAADGNYSAGLYYAGEKYGTVSYEVGASDRGIVVEFGDEDLSVVQLTGTAEEAAFISAENCKTDVPIRNGWVRWTEISKDENGKNKINYYYFIDNHPVTGWNEIDGNRYYFDPEGFMYRGWLEEEGNIWFLQASGVMRTGWMRWNDQVFYFDPEEGVSVTGWILSGDKTYYLTEDQQWLTGFHMMDGEGYFFRNNGVMATGWVKTEDGYRHFDPEGHMQSDWLVLEEGIYYLENGIMVTGWLDLSEDEKYYFDRLGCMVTGWQNVDGSVYYFDETGKMQTGWFYDDEKWFYLAPEGNRVDGWVRIPEGVFYTDPEEGMQTGWQEIEGEFYFFGMDGSMKTGWKSENGVWYYFSEDGSMVRGWGEIDGKRYYFSEAGIMMTDWIKVEGKWYYLTAKGVMVTGWKKLDGKWYYFRDGGAMAAGWENADGKWYYFKNNGTMETGWKKLDGKWYYFADNGAMITGWKKLGGKWYYFLEKGSMAAGWKEVDGKWYYFADNGSMITGWKKLNGIWYYFTAKGKMVVGWQLINGTWYYFNEKGAMLTGENLINGQWYQFRENGAWIEA